jgi:hypothetical protein
VGTLRRQLPGHSSREHNLRDDGQAISKAADWQAGSLGGQYPRARRAAIRGCSGECTFAGGSENARRPGGAFNTLDG